MTTPTPHPHPLPGMALLGALVFAVAAITAVVMFDRQHELFRPRGSTAISPAASAPSDDPPAQMDRNGQFLWRLSSSGLRIRRSNDAAINDARRVCERFVGGESEQQVIQDILSGSPGMPLDTATDFTDIAIDVYCPQGVLNSP
jgi:Protein of unknown function (DUF732)